MSDPRAARKPGGTAAHRARHRSQRLALPPRHRHRFALARQRQERKHNRMNVHDGVMIAAIVLTVGACGGSGSAIRHRQHRNGEADRTQIVQRDFSYCVVEAAYGLTPCSPDATILGASPYAPAGITCAHEEANRYVCQASAPGEDQRIAGKINGSYNVTFDGRTLAWQRTG